MKRPAQPARQRLIQNGALVEVPIISTALVDEAGQMHAIATTKQRVPSTTD
jgi:hypothetical protein